MVFYNFVHWFLVIYFTKTKSPDTTNADSKVRLQYLIKLPIADLVDSSSSRPPVLAPGFIAG